MLPLKILCFILLACPALPTPLKAPDPPKRLPVYFPITPEEFEAYGIRLPPSAASSSSSLRGDVGDLPSTTSKPTTTTMRLPIAQESHVAPTQIITESPGPSYLTDSYYYIPGHPTESSRAEGDQQDISGNPRYEDDDRGNSFIEASPSNRNRARGGSSNDDDEEEVDTPRYSVIGPDTSPQDQERFGVFFIGEHESFGGSEEHFEEVAFRSLYIPPNSDEDLVPSLQTLPAARPSSLNFGSRVTVEVPDEPVYGAPGRASSSQESPAEPQYLPPSTTRRPYEPPSTTERSYLPPSTTEGRYSAPAKESSEEAPEPVTTPRYSQPRISLSTGYGPPVTTENVYFQSRVTSSPRRYTAPTTTTTTERPYSPPRRYTVPTTTTEKPYSPPRRYNPPSTTTERAYSSPRTSAPRRYTVPPTTTERTYGVPKLVSVRKYTGPPPTTTERSYTKKSSSSRNRSRARARYTPPSAPTTTTAAPVRSRPPTPAFENPTHAVYIKTSSEEGKFREASPSGQRTSYKSREKDESSRRTYSRQPAVIKPVYAAPTNLTIKSISVATSSSSVAAAGPTDRYSKSRSQPSRSRSSSRASSTYKSPFSSEEKDQEQDIKILGSTASRSSDSRAGSKYQFPVYRTSDKAFRAPSSLYQIRDPSKEAAASQPDFVQAGDNIYIPQEYDESSIPGDAGVDYPVHRTVPNTSFRCEAQEHPGLYADTEADCQVFHICQKAGRHDSFLCPNGTVFNQQYFVCDWWYNFACDSATSFFGLNEFIYELPEEDDYRRSK